jgi:hypothetical protein
MPTRNDIPTVVVSNFAEAHIDFLSRSENIIERNNLIDGEDYHGDRTILWAGDPKLVIVNYPIAHADLNTQRLGFPNTRHMAPDAPSHYLSLDILRETRLVGAIVEYAGPKRTIQIIPYATTREFLHLVNLLRVEYQLNVLTPESPDKEHLWLRDYIDTKTGYRSLASYWISNASRILPFGMSCYDLKQASTIAYWFCSRGEACVVKADTGESGIGTTIISPDIQLSAESIYERLRSDPFYANELVVVEKFIPSQNRTSPSAEVKVPKLGEGDPQITYISNQLFLDFGDFCGIQIDRGIYSQPWCKTLEICSLEMARNLQNMGYVGHFDVDCIVSDDNEVFLLEINSRRTGGTHVHELARHVFGEDYIDKISLISFEAASSGTITDADELIEVVKDFLYPMEGDETLGMILTITKPLFKNRFGYIVLGPTSERAIELQAQIETCIKKYCGLI